MANATGRPTAPLVLSEAEREYLERQVRKHRLRAPGRSGAGSSFAVARECRARSLRASSVCMNIRLANGDGASLKTGSMVCSTKFALVGPEQSTTISLRL